MADHPSPPLTLRLFGAFEAQVHSRPLPRLRSRKGAWLLALLVLRSGRETEREFLAGMLWPDAAPEQAQESLRKSLQDLRAAFGAEAGRISSATRHSLRFDPTGADLDLLAFDAAIARGDPAPSRPRCRSTGDRCWKDVWKSGCSPSGGCGSMPI